MSSRATRRTAWLRRPCTAALVVACAASGCAAAGGPVLHAGVRVPMASSAEAGSPCDAADLRGTGPVSATIPGSTIVVYDMAAGRDVPEGGEQAAGNAASLATIGSATVPASGTVVDPVSSDPAFPSACRFTVEVPTSRLTDLYGFRVGDVYLPLPVAPRDALEKAGWVVNVAVNPQ